MIFNNKIGKLFSVLFISIILICTTSGCSFSKGRFIKLDLSPEDHNQPVALNDNEIFFAGGFDGNDHGKINPAKIFNVKEKKLTSLNVTMNFPRVSYGAIKYDDNHILIVGGSCADTDFDRNNECSRLAEIYDIKANKFTRISDSNYAYKYDIQLLLLKDGRVFIFSKNLFETFDPKENKFSTIRPLTDERSTIQEFFRSKVMLINEKEILIYGFYARRDEYKNQIECLNLETGAIKVLQGGLNTHEALKLEDGSILAAVGNKWGYKYIPTEQKLVKAFPAPSKKLVGYTALLDDKTIFFGAGALRTNNLIRGIRLVHAIYDYKRNKVYHYKTRPLKENEYEPHLITLNNALLIVGYKDTESYLYKY